ncbi:Microcystin-dependent protein [Methylobacterium sp. 174MFSha1.1]|uniref:phage tail protein n=1 Tax=Methylobacterium sp. 174MFSha1.1 TaxID=1502749 RepID=UPI0008F270BC|nr:tail fiber protein [Methylobacterium sp. 174MFSha1.1]SFV08860.1 Microcystin-dependent protein [Methylobacterium sp. 174MFSha1.1]
MVDSFIGEIRLFAGRVTPANWHDCDGSTLPINNNQALFTLLGTLYGGDGRTTFGLPNLMGRIPVGAGQLTGGQNYALAGTGGSSTATIALTQMPNHDHSLMASLKPASTTSPAGAMLADPGDDFSMYVTYASTQATIAMATDAVGFVGSAAPHENTMPSTAIRYIISLSGLFPQQN